MRMLPLLLFVASTANAQSWRPDMESGQDVFLLALVITGGLAIIDTKSSFRQSRRSGWYRAAGWAGLFAFALLVPNGHVVFFWILLLFMAVVIVQMFKA